MTAPAPPPGHVRPPERIRVFDTSVSCITRVSIPVVRKQLTASCGVSMIGSPLTLNEVLISTGTPVSASNAFSSR